MADSPTAFGGLDVVAGVLGVFDLGSAASEQAEVVERTAELRADNVFDGYVVPGGFRAQALLDE